MSVQQKHFSRVKERNSKHRSDSIHNLFSDKIHATFTKNLSLSISPKNHVLCSNKCSIVFDNCFVVFLFRTARFQ